MTISILSYAQKVGVIVGIEMEGVRELEIH